MQKVLDRADHRTMNQNAPNQAATVAGAHFEFQFVAQGVTIECQVDEAAFERWRRLGDHEGTMLQFRKYARAIATAHIGKQATNAGERWRVHIESGQVCCHRLAD